MAEVRFAGRYAEALAMLDRNGFRWVIGPPETAPAAVEQWPLLAQHVWGTARPWRWIVVEQQQAGPLGRLLLIAPGVVSDESGKPFSSKALLKWAEQQVQAASRRIAAQNEITLALNKKNRQKAQRAFPYYRVGAAVGLPVALVLLLLTWQRRGQPDFAWWAAVSGCITWMASVAASGWWSLRRRLARDAGCIVKK